MGRWLATLTDEQSELVEKRLDDPSWASAELHRRLCTVEGYNLSDFTLNRHRKGGCACARVSL